MWATKPASKSGGRHMYMDNPWKKGGFRRTPGGAPSYVDPRRFSLETRPLGSEED